MIGLVTTIVTTLFILIICSYPDTAHEDMVKIRVASVGIGIVIICLATWATAINAARKARSKNA